MDSSDATQTQPLRGVRVLSFGAFVAGNICALMLADLGAEVVKIESRDRPEALRAYDVPGRPQIVEPSGVRTTALFAGMTRGLRSACLDMTNEGGRRAFRELSARADVVLENLGPGTMESWGCSYADLRAHNADLVMLSISGYGRSGPLAAFRAYASNINNFLGHTLAWAPDGIHFDFVAGIHGACAIVAALADVARGAPGVDIDMAQTEAGAAILPALYLDYLANGREWSAGPNEVPGALFSGVFRCGGADAWVAVELEDDADWDILCTFLERPHLRPDVPGVDVVRAALEAWTATVTPLQVSLTLQGLGLAAGPVQDSEDLWRDPQHRSRGALVEVCHPDLGSLEYPDAPYPIRRDPARPRTGGPRLGEHTADVLMEWLGCGQADVDTLRSSGAVWVADEGAGPSSC
jgi:benzylsuccinate CoA-transferase BbsF subunit